MTPTSGCTRMQLPTVLLLLLLANAAPSSFGQTLSIKGTDLVDDRGTVVKLRGVNWFGFNNRQTMLDGLWAGKDSSNKDWKTIMYRLQLLGFNGIRLPFGFRDFDLPPEQFRKQCRVRSKSDLLSLTKPRDVKPAQEPAASPPEVKGGMCNFDLPEDRTYVRFVWVVQQFAAAGWYIIIDNHVRPDEDLTVHQNPDWWVERWKKLLTDLVQDPAVKSRLIVDLINEPDVTGMTWENRTVGGKVKPGLTSLYVAAMDVLHQVSPSTLFLIEGTGGEFTTIEGHPSTPYFGAFATDPQLIQASNLSDARPFFEAIMPKPYLRNIILSYHAYTTAVIPIKLDKDLWVGEKNTKRFTEMWGYLSKQGYCTKNSTCHVFPFILGEFSAPKPNNAQDALETSSFADYFNLQGAGDDGQHARLDNWFFWAWNENSGDTGGIAADNWQSIDWQKVFFLQNKYSLRPWYCSPSGTCPTTTAAGSNTARATAHGAAALFSIVLCSVLFLSMHVGFTV